MGLVEECADDVAFGELLDAGTGGENGGACVTAGNKGELHWEWVCAYTMVVEVS